MDAYMRHLIEQYKKARGIFGIDMNSIEFKIDFNNWLNQYQENGENYASLLYSLGIEFIDNKTAEVNKGSFDSVVLPYETSIVSPYMKEINRDNVINNGFYILRGKPEYKNFDKTIVRYMTHNPYSSFDNRELMNWKNMHEFTRYDIVLGMFGNLYDEDRIKKIKKLELLKKKTNVLKIYLLFYKNMLVL